MIRLTKEERKNLMANVRDSPSLLRRQNAVAQENITNLAIMARDSAGTLAFSGQKYNYTSDH